MRPDKYILDANGDPTPCADVHAWGRWFETSAAERVVAQDRDEGDPDNRVLVSTIFLALDHQFGDGPPVLWETLVFGGPLDGEMNRYTSKQDALRGHQAMCERVAKAARRATGG